MPDKSIEKLRDALRLLKKPRDFQSGDIVRWKPALRNKRFPKDDQPAIVVTVLAEDQKVQDVSKESGSAYFREPLDVILGILDEDGEFSTYHYDSRRFEKWPQDG